MTIEIFVHKSDAKAKSEKLLHDSQIETTVIKVKIDKTQDSVYGFRYIDYVYEILDTLDEGYILLWPDFDAEEAATCGLVKIPEDTEDDEEDEQIYICEDCGARVIKSEACCDGEKV